VYLQLITTPFRDWLDGKGMLFHPTTGVVTDSDLRASENPNLEAEIFCILNKEDKVEVIDRSGINTQEGSITDYWYKIYRPSDGLEGWCFGGYLDVDSD